MDVFCNQHTCDDESCGADIPRRSRFCPICGNAIWQYDPKNFEYKKQRHIELLKCALMWPIIEYVFAFVLTLLDEEIPLKVTLIIAAVLSVYRFDEAVARYSLSSDSIRAFVIICSFFIRAIKRKNASVAN